ncbi:MAG: signal recognition particle-docking protein FtsY [Chloroflexi bacterium]|nr:signal recognition particle-docking protein FtsY [Chloroflexota bacterium]
MVRFFRRKKDVPEEVIESPPEADATVESAGRVETPEAPEAEAPKSVEQAVERTRRTWFSRIGGLFRRGLDDELWVELEEMLIAADTGVETTVKLLDNLKARVKEEGIRDPEQAQQALREELLAILDVEARLGRLWGPAAGDPSAGPTTGLRMGGEPQALRQAQGERLPVPKPAVVLVVGVNGTGKTTSIGKLAHAYQQEGRKVLLAAADTFRAAAIDQLKQWGEQAGVDVIAHKQGGDPAAVVFDSLSAAESRDVDVLIIDTAGRLHTKVNLMEEMRKVNRIIQRKVPDGPHEVLLVLDATSGQNALHQAKYFTEALGVTGILLAKLDGTAKGGVVFAICDQLRIPVRFVGTGEKAGDLANFEPKRFVDALFA